jgi:glycosyltransferase involved in cell wall biosynthesis
MIAIVISNKIGGISQWNLSYTFNSNHPLSEEANIILISCIEEQSNWIDTSEYIIKRVIKFEYSKFENQYFVKKRLIKIFNNYKLIVCNDQFELSAISLIKKRPHIIANIADWYNLSYVNEYYNLIDGYITLSLQMQDVINSASSKKKASYVPHGVTISDLTAKNSSKKQKRTLVFLGRLVESKGCLDLINIENELTKNNIEVFWKIIGSGPLEMQIKDIWKSKGNIEFLKPQNNKEVYECLSGCDILVLPSVFEGYGIAILEAMSLGVIPAVYKLPLGITNEINDSNSIISNSFNINDLTQIIIQTLSNPDHLLNLQTNAQKFVQSKFDIKITSNKYFEFFEMVYQLEKKQNHFKSYKKTSILDSKITPNFLTSLIRKLKSYAFS